jgi:hypothetical protein
MSHSLNINTSSIRGNRNNQYMAKEREYGQRYLIWFFFFDKYRKFIKMHKGATQVHKEYTREKAT